MSKIIEFVKRKSELPPENDLILRLHFFSQDMERFKDHAEIQDLLAEVDRVMKELIFRGELL